MENNTETVESLDKTTEDVNEAEDKSVVKDVEKKAEVEVEKPEVQVTASKDTITDFYNPKEGATEKVVTTESIKYADFKFGKDVKISDDTFKGYTDYASKQGLKQEVVQETISFTESVVKNERQNMEKALFDRATAWDKQSRADKEIGGTNIKEKMTVVKTFMKTFGNDKVNELLRASGMGSNPEMLRMLYRAGKAISEDNMVIESSVTRNSKPNAKNIYGDTMFVFPSMENKKK